MSQGTIQTLTTIAFAKSTCDGLNSGQNNAIHITTVILKILEPIVCEADNDSGGCDAN